MITIIRNVKEAHCEVSPTPLRSRLGLDPFGHDVDTVLGCPGCPPVHVALSSGYELEVGWERFITAEVRAVAAPAHVFARTAIA